MLLVPTSRLLERLAHLFVNYYKSYTTPPKNLITARIIGVVFLNHPES